MNKEIKSVLKKAAKIAGVTCVAAGAVAIMTSGAALKAIEEGGRYLVSTVKRIVNQQDQPQEILEDASAVSGEDCSGVEETSAAEEIGSDPIQTKN